MATDGDRYALGVICELTDGGLAVQAERGAVDVDGGRLLFAPEESSCPSSGEPWEASYKLDGDTLRVVSEGTATTFRRAPENDEDASAEFGCFGPGYIFAPRPLRPVP